VKYALVVAAIMALAPTMSVSNSTGSSDSDCRGDCVGNGNARDGRECFNESEVQSLGQITSVLIGNGTSCLEQQLIVGVLLSHATTGDRCIRIDEFYCSTAVSGLAEGIRVDRDPRECFTADEASNFTDLTRTIQANGTVCPADQPVMGGVKLHYATGCWRAPLVYCQPHGDLLVRGNFEAYAPPQLGPPGWVSDSTRHVPAKSETHQPRSGTKDGACSTTTNLDCGMYQEVTAPAAGSYTFTVYANADKTGGLVGVNVNGVNVAVSKVVKGSFGTYEPYVMPFSASQGDTIRVWMSSPASRGYVVIDDATLTSTF
jgi:hypothetical protein